MKLPFVSRKKYEALQADRYELGERVQDQLRKEQRKDREHYEQIQVLRQALFHKGRADDYEQLLLKQAETRFQSPFIPNQEMLDALSGAQEDIRKMTGIDDVSMAALMKKAPDSGHDKS